MDRRDENDTEVIDNLIERAWARGREKQREQELHEARLEAIRARTKPQAPVKPDSASLYDWFDYYHACKKAGIKYRLKDIAAETGYTYGYVREQHRLYKLDRQIE